MRNESARHNVALEKSFAFAVGIVKQVVNSSGHVVWTMTIQHSTFLIPL